MSPSPVVRVVPSAGTTPALGTATTARLAGGLAAAVLLAGCGTSTGVDPTAAADPTTTPTTSSSAPADSTPAGADDPRDSAAPGGAAVPAVLEFESTTVAGDAFDARSLAGRPTVFWFWAPCGPTCRAQISGVGELADRFGDQVHVVGVGALDDPAAIEGFAAEVDPQVVQLSDDKGEVWRHFGVTAQSTYLVLDRDGRTLASGYLDDDELAEVVADLVG